MGMLWRLRGCRGGRAVKIKASGRAWGWVCCVYLAHSHPRCRIPCNMWWGWSPPTSTPAHTTYHPTCPQTVLLTQISHTFSQQSCLFSLSLPLFLAVSFFFLPHQLDLVQAFSHEPWQATVQTEPQVNVMSQRMPPLRSEIHWVLSDQRKHSGVVEGSCACVCIAQRRLWGRGCGYLICKEQK